MSSRFFAVLMLVLVWLFSASVLFCCVDDVVLVSVSVGSCRVEKCAFALGTSDIVCVALRVLVFVLRLFRFSLPSSSLMRLIIVTGKQIGRAHV